MVIFYNVSRRELQKRLDILLAAGIQPGMPQDELLERIDELLAEGILPEIPQHEFWYYCRSVFLKENKDLKKIDSKAKNVHANWGGTILPMWFVSKGAKQLGLDLHYPDGGPYRPNMNSTEKKDCMWDLPRYALNIVPKPTAICYGAGKPFLISRRTAKYVTKERSLILVCEKSTVAEKILDELKAAGYRINTVGTGGCTPMEAQRVVINAAKEMEEKRVNFWVLVLHDYDIAGVQIYSRLKQWGGECVIDIGVNREFLDYLQSEYDLDMRLLEEQVLVKNHAKALREWIAEGDRGYSLEDYDYLQGEPYQFETKDGKIKTHYNAMRIEIDPIEVEHTIKPYIKFILAKIESACRVWDLRRFGVREEDFELSNPDCRFTKRMDGYKEPDYEEPEGIVEGYNAPVALTQKVENLWDNIEPLLEAPFDSAKDKILALVDRVCLDVEDAVVAQEVYEEFQPVLEEYAELVKTSKEIMEQATTLRGFAVGDVMALEETMKVDLSDLKKQIKDDTSALRVEYEDDFDIDWTEAHDEEHQAILGQVEYYEGDVRLGAEDLKARTEDLQKRINKDSAQYPNFDVFDEKLEGFEQSHATDLEKITTETKEKLEEIDSKLDDFDLQEERIDAFQGLDEKRILELMVDALQQRLEEIDDE